MRLFHRLRRVYFFGYGADSEPDLVRAVTGRKPRVVGKAVLHNHSLRIQTISEVKSSGANPQAILNRAWGEHFRSYVIMPQMGARVSGTLYRISLHDRHLIDSWELVELGWYDKAFVEVEILHNGHSVTAETQVLGAHQTANLVVDGSNYEPWLQPKKHLIQFAASLR